MMTPFHPPDDWLIIKTIDAHAAGEPLRVVTAGLPALPGDTILAKRRYAQDHFDHIRRTLMWEPRGHADMYGCFLIEPVNRGSDIGVLFLHNEGYSTMCGHGIIALTTVAFECGLIEKKGSEPELRIDTPAGLVVARARREKGRVKEVSFANVPSFVYALGKTAEIPGMGDIPYDLAFGGAFYAFCEASDVGVRLVPKDFRRIIDAGRSVKEAVRTSLSIRHPFEEDLGFLYGTILTGPPLDTSHFGRNVCVFADGEVDRSPTGTGVSARAALHYAKGEIRKNEEFVIESLLGTCFKGKVLAETTFGPYKAVIPEVTGSAWLTGNNEFWINPCDPLREGFLLR